MFSPSVKNNLINVHEDNFREEILQSDKLTLVYFWTHWIDKCSDTLKVLDSLSRFMTKSVKFTEVNLTLRDKLASYFRVGQKPTILFFKNGRKIYSIDDTSNRAEIRKAINYCKNLKFD
ncbi:MAG: thioredoxin family protein [Candidatus Gastranaerophilaceae bacterium]